MQGRRHHPRGGLLAVAGGAMAVGLVAFTAVRLLHRRLASVEDFKDKNVSLWTPAEVEAWLCDIGAGRNTQRIFKVCNISGCTLLELTAKDLQRMGVLSRDARIILASLPDLQWDSAATVEDKPSHTVPVAHVVARMTPVAAAVLRNANDMFTALMVPRSGIATPVGGPNQGTRMVSHLYNLLNDFHALSTTEQTSLMVPLEQCLSTALRETETNEGALLKDAAPVYNAIPPEMEAELRRKLQPLYSMVNSFSEFLASPELDSLPPAEFEELQERISVQIKRAMTVAQQLPVEVGGPLLQQCESIFGLLARRQRTKQQRDAEPVPDVEPAFLMKKLGSITTRVKDSALQQLSPAERIVVFEGLVKEVMEVRATAAAGARANSTQDGRVIAVADGILSLLLEAVNISKQEQEAGTAAVGVDTPHSAVNVLEEGGKNGDTDATPLTPSGAAQLDSIATALQKMLLTLQSPAFLSAPADLQKKVAEGLLQRISAMQEEVSALPHTEQGVLSELLQNTREYLSRILRTTASSSVDGVEARKAGVSEKQRAESNNQEDQNPTNSDSAPEEEGEEEGGDGEGEEDVTEAYVEQLSRIFNFLTAEEFEKAEPSVQQKLAGRLLQLVIKIKEEVEEQDSMAWLLEELVIPLYTLLSNIAGSKEMSQQFKDISESLEYIHNFLQSPAFQGSTFAKKLQVACTVIPQLQQITSSFANLSPAERAAADELTRPINEILTQLSKSRDAATVDPRDILNRIHKIMCVVQEPSFIEMTPEERSDWVNAALKELATIGADCANAGPESQTLLSMVQKLTSELSQLSLSPKASSTTPEDDTDAAEEPRDDTGSKGIFEKMRQMSTALDVAKGKGKQIPVEVIQEMLDVVQCASEEGPTTAAQESLLMRFVDQLKNSIESLQGAPENATATPTINSVEDFKRGLIAILEQFTGGNSATRHDVQQATQLLDRLLTAANCASVDWRSDEAAAKLVQTILVALQRTQEEEAKSSEASISNLCAVLSSAVESIKQHPPASRQELLPYASVLQLAQSAANQLEEPEMQLIRELQAEVLHAMQAIVAEPPGAEAIDRPQSLNDRLLEMSENLRDEVLSPEKLTSYETAFEQLSKTVQGDPDYAEVISCIRQQIELQRLLHQNTQEEEEESEEEEGSEEEEDTEDTSSINAAKKVANCTEKAEVKEQENEEGEHEPIPSMQACAADANGGGDAFNEDDDENETVTPGESVAAKEYHNADYPEDVVPGGLENEVMLFPKIEDRLKVEASAFVASNTTTDIQNISKVLLHISSSSSLMTDEAFRTRVDAAKVRFLELLSHFKKSESPSCDAQASKLLKVTCQHLPDTVGSKEGIRELIIFTDDDADASELTENCPAMQHMLKDANAHCTAAGLYDRNDWVGKSVAVLVYVASPDEPATAENTGLAELSLLHEVLVQRYGFDVTSITDPHVNADSLMSLLRRINEQAAPKRLLLYFYTAPGSLTVSVPQSMTFADDSSLSYTAILRAIDSIERAVVCHCRPLQLDVQCRLADDVSSTMTVRVTKKAWEQVGRLRCWLYSGLFTPSLVELLSRDEKTTLCPEDFVNYAITTMTSAALQFGSFMDDKASSMPYLIPLDDQ